MQYKFSYKFTQRDPGALTVCNTGIQRCEPDYSWGPGVRDQHLIHYIIAGKGAYQAGGRSFTLSAGDLFLALPGERIFYQADHQSPWEYCWVGFRGSDAATLLEQGGLSGDTPVLRAVSEDVYGQMMQIYHAQGSLPHQAAYMTGALYQLLAALMRDRRAPAPHRGDDCVQRACAYIADHLALPIGVEDIAAHVGLSRSRLYRLFMAKLGLSPVQVLTQERIRLACTLLRRGDLSVKAVAASVGYENQLYFSRRFREIMGCPPSQFAQGPSGDLF